MNSLFRPVFLLLFALLVTARAQFGAPPDLVKSSLVADTKTVAAGKPFTVLVRMELKQGWHVYWQFGGDSGAPPRVTWELPEGFTAGPIQWPLPKAHLDEGDFLTYIYEGEVALPVTITPPATLTAKEVPLKAKLSYLVCEQTCIPGRGEVALTLPVGPAAEPAEAELFAKALSQLPRTEPPPFKAAWEVKPEAFAVKISGLDPQAKVEFYPLPPAPEAKPKRATVGAPDSQGDRTISVPIESGGAADTAWSGLLVAQLADGPRTGWMLHAKGDATTPGTSTTTATPTAVPEAPRSLFVILLSAFAGGLILNLMPCVLPVIALKIFSFVSQAGEHPERVFRLGLAFVAGVFTFFLLTAGLAITLRATGHNFAWGMQFSDPRPLLVMIALIVVFALSMFGIFEITLGGSTENTLGSLSRKEGYSGAFVHGLFTTLLGTSCTAPLVGSTLGVALTQPPLGIIAIFSAMAAGMSLPYFLLTWKPAWMRFLPKPGMWMERFKQLMGFVLLAVAVWLLGSLSQNFGSEAATAATWLLLFLSLAGWIYGAGQRRAGAAITALAVIALGCWLFLPTALTKKVKTAEGAAETNEHGLVWTPFSPEGVEKAREAGQPVFIDFTASWCINCKVNEKAVLNTAPISAAFKERGVLTMKADWSSADPVITEWLKKFNRIGVPVYVLYRSGEASPVVFPELLTQGLVLGELGKIPVKK